MYKWFARRYVCAACVWSAYGPPESRVTGGCKLSCGCWGEKQGLMSSSRNPVPDYLLYKETFLPCKVGPPPRCPTSSGLHFLSQAAARRLFLNSGALGYFTGGVWTATHSFIWAWSVLLPGHRQCLSENSFGEGLLSYSVFFSFWFIITVLELLLQIQIARQTSLSLTPPEFPYLNPHLSHYFSPPDSFTSTFLS